MLDKITRNEVKLFLFIMHYPCLTQNQIGLIYKQVELKNPKTLAVKLGEESTLSDYLQRLRNRKLVTGGRNTPYEVSTIPFITPLPEFTPTLKGETVKTKKDIDAEYLEYFFRIVGAKPNSPITPRGVIFSTDGWTKDKKGMIRASTKETIILDSPVPEEQLNLILLIEKRKESIYSIVGYIRNILDVFVSMSEARETDWNDITQKVNHEFGLKINPSFFKTEDIKKLCKLHIQLGEFYKHLRDAGYS